VPPTTAFSLITELIHQDALRPALSGRDDILLEPILSLLVKYVSDPRFGELACDVAIVLLGMFNPPYFVQIFEYLTYLAFYSFVLDLYLDMYASAVGQSPLIDALFVQLRKKIKQEILFQRELVSVRGALEMILAASTLDSPMATQIMQAAGT
jgi:U3 small nucleolar RNA-associated protein 15